MHILQKQHRVVIYLLLSAIGISVLDIGTLQNVVLTQFYYKQRQPTLAVFFCTTSRVPHDTLFRLHREYMMSNMYMLGMVM